MNTQKLDQVIHDYNDEEEFYRDYYYAKQQEYSLQKFLNEIDMDFIYKRHLMIPEINETIPPIFEDYFFLDINDDKSIGVVKHNRFTPSVAHSHNFFEVIYVYEGQCSHKIGSAKVDLRYGDICIIPPGITHTIEVFDDSIVLNVLIRKLTLHDIFFNFLRTPNVLTEYFLGNMYTQNGNDYIIFHTGNDPDLKQKFLYMLSEANNKDIYYYQMISNTLMLIFGILIRNYASSVELPTFNHKTDVQRYAILTMIQDNYADITLDDIAERLHYTKEYTSKLIRTTTGMNFSDIQRQIRMEKAKLLLKDTSMSIADIGFEVGYKATEHFVRTFKKTYNETPNQYRRFGRA